MISVLILELELKSIIADFSSTIENWKIRQNYITDQIHGHGSREYRIIIWCQKWLLLLFTSLNQGRI